MRYLALLISIMILFASCRKNTLRNPAPDKPVDPVVEWKYFTRQNSPLHDDQVNAIAIDRNDVKWIGTSKGVLRIDGDAWTVFKIAKLPDAYITSIAIDNEGGIWVGTTQGLAYFKDNTWKIYTPENSALGDDEIMCMTYDKKRSVLWVGTSLGFARITKESFTYHDDISHELSLSMTTDVNGALWIGSFNHLAFRGVIRKFENDHWTSFQLVNLGYHSAFPYAITTDGNGDIIAALAGTQVREVIRYSNGGWSEIERPENARGFKTLLVENEKIWAGGTSLALMGNKTASTIAIPGTDSPIQCMAIDSKGAKWIGTMSGGIAVYNSK